MPEGAPCISKRYPVERFAVNRSCFSFRTTRLILLCVLGVLSLAACGASSAARNSGPEDARPVAQAPAPAERAVAPAPAPVVASIAARPGLPSDVPACWLPLARRLQSDPAAPPDALRHFAALPAYSPAPMGTKIRELFTSAFMRKPKTGDQGAKLPPSRIYRNIVTPANMEKCDNFLAANKAVFDRVERKYPVPREILVSLLFVETRLGTFVGKENAFWSLACMAAAESPDMVNAGLGDIPITVQHNAWLQSKLTDKSAWAYKELRALLAYCTLQNLDPHGIPGSVYGAIGLCQFMPSNLTPYADDGDGDGVINLFSEPDAIFSAASYLTKHGWRAGASVDAQRSVLKRYNNLNIYANTILALAESLRTGAVQTGPPDAPKIKTASAKQGKAAAKQGKAAARSGAKKTAVSAKAAPKRQPKATGASAPASAKKSNSAAQAKKTAAASSRTTPGGALP